MEKKIALLPGGGIGAEVLAQAEKALRAVGGRFGHKFCFERVAVGLSGPLDEATLARCLAADSVLAGVGTGRAIGQLGRAMALKARMRPALLYPQLAGASPLAPALVKQDIDLMLVQTMGAFLSGEEEDAPTVQGEEDAVRVARIAFRTAEMRRCGLVFVEQPGLEERARRCWRALLGRVAESFPRVKLELLGVSEVAARLLQDPARFDVILADGVCGAVLAGEAAGLTGSAGMMSCAALGVDRRGLYHPVLGPSPDMAGQNLANPVGAVYAGALLLKYAFGMAEECAAIEEAVQRVLDDGYRTADILAPRCRLVSCERMGELIAAALTSPALYRRVVRGTKDAGDGFGTLQRKVSGAARM